MDRIGQITVANNRANEDFVFSHRFGEVQLLVVGDFAHSNYEPIDAATTNALQLLTSDTSVIEAAGKSVPLLLSQLATKLNARLLGFAERNKAKFQSVAMFAATSGTDLFYLPVGDCRLSVYTGKSLVLLNGSIWVDSSGNRLPMVVEPGQEVFKGSEADPDKALGISPELDVSSDHVRYCPLNESDLVLLYSDGVDKFVSPVRLLQLIQEQASDATIESLLARTMEEARLEHCNDDRTLLVFAGPHVRREDELLAESIREIQKMSANMHSALERISLLENSSTRLKTSVDQVATQVKDLPAQLRSSSGEADGLSGRSLGAILGKLNDIQNRVKNIENSGGPHEDSPPATKSGQQKKEAAKPTSPPEVFANDSALSSGRVSELVRVNLNAPFREGVVRITPGFYELVDDASYHEAGAKWLEAPKSVPPGWLTAACLYLRLVPDQPKETEITDAIREWIQKHIGEAGKAVENLSPETLDSLRRDHWRLREKRRSRQRLWLTDNRLIKLERELANKTFGTTESVSVEGSGVKAYNPDPKLRSEKIFKYVVMAGAVVAAILFATVIYTIWFQPAAKTDPPPKQDNSANTNHPVTLDYGAEGRTLLAVQQGRRTEIAEYRIRIGDEQAFRNAFPKQSFNSREELIKAIEEKAGRFVSRENDEDYVGPEVRTFKIEAADVSNPPATGIEKCTRFLARVNKKLPKGVHNDLQDLEELNFGLKCAELKPEDLLVVYNIKR